MISDKQPALPWLAETPEVTISRADLGIAVAGMVIAARRLGISPAPESREAGARVEEALAALVQAVAVHDLKTFLWGASRCPPASAETTGKNALPPPVPTEPQATAEAGGGA